MNEKEYIRNILASKKKPDDLSMGYFITLIAKYYFSDELDAEQLSDIVKEKMLAFDLDNYQEYKYHIKILNICEGLFDYSTDRAFKEIEYIPIYENELKFINALSTDKQKKIMFTFFAVARYMDCDGWINKKTSKDISEVFKLANVTLTSDKRNELLHELYVNGYISFGKKVDNLNIRVKLDDSGEIEYKIMEFNNLGNQYIGNFKNGYKQCRKCGRIIRITGTNNQYCKKCIKEKQLEWQRESMKKIRENKKCEVS